MSALPFFDAFVCHEPDDVRVALGAKRNEKWLFEHPILHRNEPDASIVYMMFRTRDRYGESLNIPALRMMVDLGSFAATSNSLYGEGIHDYCPRGDIIFFRMTPGTAGTDSKLLNYTWDQFTSDWPYFFRVGPHLPYYALEKAYYESDMAPMDDFWRVAVWDPVVLSRLVMVVMHRKADYAGDRDRALGWVIAVCVRRLYGSKIWETINLGALMKQGLQKRAQKVLMIAQKQTTRTHTHTPHDK